MLAQQSLCNISIFSVHHEDGVLYVMFLSLTCFSLLIRRRKS